MSSFYLDDRFTIQNSDGMIWQAPELNSNVIQQFRRVQVICPATSVSQELGKKYFGASGCWKEHQFKTSLDLVLEPGERPIWRFSKGHAFTYSSIHGPGTGIMCDLCHLDTARYSNAHGYWHCQTCPDYDLCWDCYLQYLS